MIATPVQKSSNFKTVFDFYNPKYITWEFYSKYLDKTPPFGELGLLTYLRTYSRFLKCVQRREYWQETTLRWVEGSLDKDNITSFSDKQKEAENLFHTAFNMRGFPAGRTLWLGGTKITKKFASGEFNCSAATIDSLSKIAEGFGWLMFGAGFGFSLEKQYINKLPNLYKKDITFIEPKVNCRNNIKVHYSNKPYNYNLRLEKTILKINNEFILEYSIDDLNFDDEHYIKFNNIEKAIIIVGDDKFGWVNAFRLFLHLLSKPEVKQIIINFTELRPEGFVLNTFGGKSSGYSALADHFETVYNIVHEKNSKRLSSVDWLDIINSMGQSVVVGGVRRSSELALSDMDDTDFINAKYNMYDPESDNYSKRNIRTMSNNDVVITEKLTKDQITEVIKRCRYNGDPNFSNRLANQNRIKEILSTRMPDKVEDAANFVVTNPCHEISLTDRGLCNLVEAVVSNHIHYEYLTNRYEFDFIEWENTLRLLTRQCVRNTLLKHWHYKWTETQWKYRLLGVSMTGYEDTMAKLQKSKNWQENFLIRSKEIVVKEATKYCDSLNINYPYLMTTIKPSGTLSLLPTVSSGVHRSFSPYYIRRMRISKTDAIAQSLLKILPLKECISPENYTKPLNSEETHKEMYDKATSDEERLNILYDDNCNTWVFTFAIKSDTSQTAVAESALSQLERYKMFMKHYVDHNVSITVYVGEHEWQDVIDWIYENQDVFVGVSFLGKFDPITPPFPQPPLQTCSKEDYEYYSQFMNFQQSEFINIIAEHEKKDYTGYDIKDNSCSKGGCPTR